MPPSKVGKVKLIVCLIASVGSLHAGIVYDASASLTGTRWTGAGGGLIDGGGSAYDDLMLSWSIAALPDSSYQYTYTITSEAVDDHEGPHVNHAIVESDGCNGSGGDAATCISSVAVDSTPALAVYGAWMGGTGNPGPPEGIDGLNFVKIPEPATQTIVISFISPDAPVWGDFYLTGGKQYVFNLGNLDHSDPNTMDFVATPGVNLSPAPEPGTLALAGVALTALGLMRRGRRGS